MSQLQYTRKKRYKIFESYFEDYCEYFEWWSLLSDCLERQSLKKAIQYQEKFTEYGVACEIMLSIENPIDSVLGYPIKFLGIDIIDEWDEAPLSSVFDGVPWSAQRLLNENGLCTNEEVAEAVMTILEGDHKKMKKIYIYKLKGL